MKMSRDAQYKRILQGIEDRKQKAVVEEAEYARRAALYPEMLAALKEIYQLLMHCDITSNTPSGTVGIVRVTNLIAKCEASQNEQT